MASNSECTSHRGPVAPPVELRSILVALATAAIVILALWALMMPPGVAYGARCRALIDGFDPVAAGLAGVALPAQYVSASDLQSAVQQNPAQSP